jgi:hypothetical protein
MIIETPLKANDIISIKLTSGEEIITKLIEEKDNKLVVSKPLSLTATQQGMGLAPFMFTIDPAAKVQINQSAIITVVKTQEEMAANYIQSTSGIAVA